jgi:putative transposase
MAVSQSTTSAEVVAKALIEDHPDFLRESVAMIANRTHGGRDLPPDRRRQRGDRRGQEHPPQRLPPQALGDPGRRDRAGGVAQAQRRELLPELLEPRKRSEKALLGVVMEANVNGVSTRKVDHLVSELGIHMSKDQVSRICRELDEQVEAFRGRAGA